MKIKIIMKYCKMFVKIITVIPVIVEGITQIVDKIKAEIGNINA